MPRRSIADPTNAHDTHVQYLQLLGLFVLAERHVRQLTETWAALAALLGPATRESDLQDMVLSTTWIVQSTVPSASA